MPGLPGHRLHSRHQRSSTLLIHLMDSCDGCENCSHARNGQKSIIWWNRKGLEGDIDSISPPFLSPKKGGGGQRCLKLQLQPSSWAQPTLCQPGFAGAANPSQGWVGSDGLKKSWVYLQNRYGEGQKVGEKPKGIITDSQTLWASAGESLRMLRETWSCRGRGGAASL